MFHKQVLRTSVKQINESPLAAAAQENEPSERGFESCTYLFVGVRWVTNAGTLLVSVPTRTARDAQPSGELWDGSSDGYKSLAVPSARSNLFGGRPLFVAVFALRLEHLGTISGVVLAEQKTVRFIDWLQTVRGSEEHLRH